MDYKELKEIVDEHIIDYIPKNDENNKTLYEAMSYSLTAGGKRFRPILLLSSAITMGVDINKALPYAIAIEYIHTYSLIHDDLPAMDDDDLRRGKPSCHKVFGEDMAILAGDGLLNLASEIMLQDIQINCKNKEEMLVRINAARAIMKAAGCQGMIGGQVHDLKMTGNVASREMLEYTHLNKTAALIAAACIAGIYLGKGKEEKVNDFYDLGNIIGLGFQIRDDILDVTGTEEKLGKKTGSDKALRKNTYASLIGIEESKKELENLADRGKKILAKYDEADFFYTLIDKLLYREA